jgi:cell division protein FtsB
VKLGRVIGGILAFGALTFGYAGGEYSTGNWRTLKDNVAVERRAVARLQVEIDSLRRVADALESDPAAQERAARERFGMLRPGEFLYRIQPVPGGRRDEP